VIDTSEFLPINDVFESPHSSIWHRNIAQDNTILLTQVGSGLHGVTDHTADDRDEMGICIEPPSSILGHEKFSMYEYRTQPMGVRSGVGDLDLNVYGLHKISKLLGAGNPTVLMPLFAPEFEIVRSRWPGKDLRECRKMFISTSAGQRFLGYMERQIKRFDGSLAQRTNRPELIEKYGYDSKFVYHALRLGIQGEELMRTGKITLPMTDHHREYLLSVRHGELKRNDVYIHLGRKLINLETAIENSRLPEHADWDAINAWCADTYLGWWDAA
jgi:predicted nucleotidyltransferase